MNVRTFFATHRFSIFLASFLLITGGLVLLVGDLWIKNADLSREVNVLRQRTAIAEAKVTGLINPNEQSDIKAPVISEDVATDIVPAPNDTDHYNGPKNAPVVLIEYSEFECPFCKKNATTITGLRNEYGDKVVHIMRHYPLSKHINAFMEAQAAECVAKSNGDEAFYNYAITVFSRSKSTGTSFDQAGMVEIAKELGYDSEKVNSCITNEETKALVESHIKQAQDADIRGTPGTFVRKSDGTTKYVVGAVDISVFRSVIDEYLR